jgi:hypothetical protein
LLVAKTESDLQLFGNPLWVEIDSDLPENALAKRYPQYREVLFPPPKPKRSKRVPRLSISILDYAEIPHSPDQYNFNFEFHCTDCGGFVITAPDDEQDAVLCAACGAQYGSFAKLKATCRTIALDKMKALKLGAFRGE